MIEGSHIAPATSQPPSQFHNFASMRPRRPTVAQFIVALLMSSVALLTGCVRLYQADPTAHPLTPSSCVPPHFALFSREHQLIFLAMLPREIQGTGSPCLSCVHSKLFSPDRSVLVTSAVLMLSSSCSLCSISLQSCPLP